ncbi:MAG: thiamine diphosphokinase [Rickettsiales bacterium]|nr:thiamine diphosphokinase [Rickettsiales bacterium]
MFKSILCLNGLLPNKNTIKTLAKDSKIMIAADGAANKLIRKNIVPSYIIGDLDSLDTKQSWVNSKIINIQDQNTTDFEKCIDYINTNMLFPTLVLGINGGEIDHIIDNLNKFIKYSSTIPMMFFDMPNKWGIAMTRTLLINTELSNIVSIFPFLQNTHLKSQGLQWELNSDEHSILQNTSTRNKTTTKNAIIQSSHDSVLVITESKKVPFKFLD